MNFLNNIAYYTTKATTDNFETKDKPLHINCTGISLVPYKVGHPRPSVRKDFYVMFVCTGELSIMVDDKSYTFKSGQAIIIPPHTTYKYENLQEVCVEYCWVHFTGADAAELLSNARLTLKKPFSVLHKEKIINTFYGLFREYEHRDFLFDISTSARLISLCTLFARSATTYSENKRKPGTLNKALKYISENYKNQIKIKELAEMEYISDGHFRVLFKEKTGTTPKNYINDYRLNSACSLLLQTNMSVKEIAAYVGFDDQLYFSRLFSSRFGISPKKFRNNTM